MFCFMVLHRHCGFCFLFSNLSVCGNPTSSELIGAIFQQYLLTSCFCHVLVVLAIFQTRYQQKDHNALKFQMMVSIF